MKIQAIKSQTNKSDILDLDGNELTINNTIFPLDNLPEYPTEENADTKAFLDANQLYKDAQGIEQLKVYVNQEDFFDYVNNNFKLFFDTDLNGDIDRTEFGKWAIHYNLSEPEKVVNRRAIKESFTAEEWIKRMETCNPNR